MYRIIILIRTPSVFSCTCTFFNVGEVSMQKVKVHRYVSGKRPEYAPESSTEEESEEEDFVEKRVTLATQAASGAVGSTNHAEEENDEEIVDDPRLRRLKVRRYDDVHVHSDEDERIERHR